MAKVANLSPLSYVNFGGQSKAVSIHGSQDKEIYYLYGIENSTVPYNIKSFNPGLPNWL